MLANHLFLTGRHLPFLEADKGGGGGGGGSNEGEQDPPIPEGLSENDKAAMRRMAQQRDAARQAAAAGETELAALRQEKADRDTAEEAARVKAQEEQGQFEQLAADRLVTVGKLEKELKELKESLGTALDEEWKSLPEEVLEVYPGEPDDSAAKLKFLPKARKLVEKIGSGSNTGNGVVPKPAGQGGDELPTAEALRKEMAESRGIRI